MSSTYKVRVEGGERDRSLRGERKLGRLYEMECQLSALCLTLARNAVRIFTAKTSNRTLASVVWSAWKLSTISRLINKFRLTSDD